LAIPTNRGTHDSQSAEISERGLATALMFLAVAAYLYASPNYFVLHVASRLVGAAFAVIGVFGLGIELARLDSGKRYGLNNLGFGLGFGLLWAVLHYRSDSLLISILIFPMLMLAANGIALAVIQMVKSIYSPHELKGRPAPKGLLLVAGQLAGFVLTVLQIVQIARGE